MASWTRNQKHIDNMQPAGEDSNKTLSRGTLLVEWSIGMESAAERTFAFQNLLLSLSSDDAYYDLFLHPMRPDSSTEFEC